MNFIVTSRKCFSELINGSTFTANASDYGTCLKGSVMERVKMDYTLTLEFGTVLYTDGGFDVQSTYISRAFGSFVDDKWQVGDTFTYVGATSNFTGVILTVATDRMDYTVLTGTLAPGVGGSNCQDGDNMHGTTTLDSAILNFGLIENNNPLSFVSLTDGSDMGYVKDSLTSSLADMVPIKGAQSWRTGEAQCRLVSVSSYVYTYQFTHELIINPFYIEDFVTDLEDGTVPALYKGINSLKYVFRLEVRNSLSNPNLYKRYEEPDTLGSVGWFNENYNGFQDNYSVSSVSYNVAGLSVDQLQVTDTTTVVINLTATSNLFVVSDPFVLYHAKAPLVTEYENNSNTLEENFLYESYRAVQGGTITGLTGIFKTISSVVNSPTSMTITATVSFTTAQQALIDSTYSYLLAVGIGNALLSTDDSDKVVLLADYNTYEQGTDVEGLLTETSIELYDHPTDDTGSGYTDYKGWIEDGVLARNIFVLHLDQGAVLNSIKFNLVAYNPTTGDSFELQEYVFNIDGQTTYIQGGYNTQQISLSTTRGFKLATGDQFNKVEISTGTYSSNDIPYTVEIGFKLDWQNWIALPGANAVFATKTHNSSLYSLQNGYEIRAWFTKNVSGTDYVGSTPALQVYDYDVDANTTPQWTSEMTLYDEDDNEVSTVIAGAITKMEIVWTPASGDTADWPGFYGIHRIEQYEAQGYNIEEFGSVRTPLSTGVLQPTTGYTQLQVDVVTANVTTTCLIDGTKLTGRARYKLSGRLGVDGALDAPIAEFTGDTEDVEAGEWDIGVDFTAGFGSLSDDDVVIIKLYIGAALVETLTGYLNDDISTFSSVMEPVYSAKQSLNQYATGLVEETGTIVWDKFTWATDNEWINLDAQEIDLTMSIRQASSGITSALDTDTVTVSLQPPEYTLETRYLQTDGDYIYSNSFSDDTESIAKLNIADGWSEEILQSPNGNPITYYLLDPDEDTVLFCECDQTTQASNRIYRATKLGSSPYAYELLVSNFAAAGKYPHMITKDDKRTANGENVYWVGMSETSDLDVYFLFMLYYNGTAWALVDFSTKVATVLQNTATRVEVNLTFDGVCYLAKNGNTVGNERAMLRMVQSGGTDTTVADFIDTANWDTATVMCGNIAGGTTDGTGGVAKFAQVQNIIMLEDDGTRPTVLWVTDRNNHTIRQLDYESGTDNYSTTTIVGSAGVNDYVDATGTSARFDLPSGMCTFDQANIYIGDSNNHYIRKVTYPGLVVTTLSGTGDDAFRLGTLY